jgi:hypothetical protein
MTATASAHVVFSEKIGPKTGYFKIMAQYLTDPVA